MKERMKRFKKLGVTVAALLATLTMGATATMAAWDTQNGKGNNDQSIVIGKSLKTPLNWDPATLNVEFTVTPAGFQTEKDGTFAAVDELTFDGPVVLTKADFTTANKVDEKEQVKYWGAETGNLVSKIKYGEKTGLEALAAVAEAQGSTGTVKFTVTETKFEYTDATNTTSVTSLASYDLLFGIDYKVVDNKPTYQVSTIVDKKITNDDGTNNGNKVDPTPGSTDVKETTYTTNGKITDSTTNLNYKLSGMLFNNDITKTEQPKNPDQPTKDENAFDLEKVNDGGDANQEFTFKVKLTAPDLAAVDKAKSITVKIVDKETGDEKSSTTVTYGTAATLKLKGGQKAVFGQMYNSTKIEINEDGTPNYVPSYAGTYGDSTAQTLSAGSALALKVGDKAYAITKTEADAVTYTNKYQSVTPTGIIMNNIAFFVMILIGACAVAATFAFRARRRVAGK